MMLLNFYVFFFVNSSRIWLCLEYWLILYVFLTLNVAELVV
jgi:hypothetical protein